MGTIKGLFDRGFGIGAVALLAAFALMVTAPLGCTKKEEEAKKAPEPAAEQPRAADDPAREHFEKGVRASMAGDYETAIAEYQKTLEYNPQSAETYNNMGFAYFDMGEYEKAIENQKKALEINPNLPNGYYGLALALEKTGDSEGALENWKAFIKYAEPHSKWWIKAQERISNIENGGEAAEGADEGGK